MEKFIIGQEVVRIGSNTDYTLGRVGVVIELNNEKQKARIRWFASKSGEHLNRRSWMSFKFITAKNFF